MTSQISVIIPAHNEEKYIVSVIEAFQKQTLLPLEIIVVCDACTDQTPKLAKKFGARVLIKNYRNTSLTRNAGIRAARGELLVIQDADTLPAPNYLAKVSQTINNKIVYGTAKITPESTSLLPKFHIFLINSAAFLLGGFNGASLFTTKNALLKTKLYDPATPWAEDWEICMQLKKQGKWRVLFDTYVIYSERKMKENGYLREYYKRIIKVFEFFWYLLKRNFYIRPKAI